MSGNGIRKLRSGVLVTGTEVLSGVRSDRNGPWLARELRAAGLDPAEIVIVGDRERDISAALRQMAQRGHDLIVTTGGLGPTADDMTTELVAGFLGLRLALDEELQSRIAAIVAPLKERYPGLDVDALEAGTAKQARVPLGATVIDPIGTAPGLIARAADGHGPLVVVLPGPPRELQPMWRAAVKLEPLRTMLAEADRPELAVILLFGIPESEIAESLRAAVAAGIDLSGMEITTCLHRGEIEVSTAYQPDAADRYERLAAFIAERHSRELFSADGESIDEQVGDLLRAGGQMIATAESCTAGMLASRLADLPGASDYLAGGLVVYANAAKTALAGVEARLIERCGAVSAEVAEALAIGAMERLDATVGVGITGVAGPTGGGDRKPVGTVWLSVAVRGQAGSAGGRREAQANAGAASAGSRSPAAGRQVMTRQVLLPGSRSDVRERACTVAMHMIRRSLIGAAVGQP